MPIRIIKPTKQQHITQEEKVMADILSGIVWILYIVLGYWSVGQTIYANKIIIGPMGILWIKRFILGFMFGWVLIPVAISMRLGIVCCSRKGDKNESSATAAIRGVKHGRS